MRCGRMFAFTFIVSLLLTALFSCGVKQEVKPESGTETATPHKESIKILNELDKATLLEMSEGADKVEIEYRTYGGSSPKPSDYFIRFFTIRDVDKAWNKFKQLTKNYPESPYGEIGQIYFNTRMKVYDQVKKKIEELSGGVAKDDPLFAYVVGDFYFSTEAYEKAFEAFKIVTEKVPGNLLVTLRIAKLYKTQDKIEEAIALYKEAIEVNSKIFILQSDIGDLYSDAKDFEQALAAYQKAAEIKPNDFSVHVKIGDIHKSQERPQEAAAAYEKAVEINSSDKATLKKLDDIYTAQNDLEGVYKTLSRLIEMEQKDAALHLRIGKLAFQMEKIDRATTAFDAVIKIDDSNAQAFLGLARAFKKQGQDVKAVENYLKALSLDSSMEDAKSEYDAIKGAFNIGEPITGTPDSIYNKIAARIVKIAQDYQKEGKPLKGEVEVFIQTDDAGKIVKLEFIKDTVNNEKVRASIFGNIFEASFPAKKAVYNLPFNFQ